VNLWLFLWFNAVGSETLQTVLLCLWFSFTFFAMRSAKRRVWVGVAVIVSLLVFNHPGNQTFALCFLLPLLIANVSVKRRFMLSGTFLITYAAAHLAFCSVNYTRFSLPVCKPSQIPSGTLIRARFRAFEKAAGRSAKVETCALKVPAFTLSVWV
jgi:hypothetical protein